MKKINILFISAIVILFIGCNTEMRIEEQLNIAKEDVTLCSGAQYFFSDIANWFRVSIVDSNNVERILKYGEYVLVNVSADASDFKSDGTFVSFVR